MIAQITAWIIALLTLAVALALAVTAMRFRKPLLALYSVVPVAVGLAGIVLHTTIPAPDRAVAVVAAIIVGALGVIGGNPITTSALAFAGRGSPAVDGRHGGIIVDSNATTATRGPEVLRGGTVIGYLERLVLIVAIVLGRLEIVAALIAIKGLGRFSELDSPEVRERFIIGTLVSLVWAGSCALLIVL